MAVTLVSTGVQFPDNSIQTTAATGGVTSLNGQTGAITNTSLYAIGSYVMGCAASATTYAVNSTLAGSSLYATSNNGGYTFPAYGGTWNDGSGQTLVNTGTWRCVSPVAANGVVLVYAGLWVRIS
jgi:hypothetical protein